MRKNQKWILLSGLASLVLLTLVAFFVAESWKAADKLPGAAPLAEFPKIAMAQAARERFLDADFMIVKDVRSLPQPVLRMLTGKGGSRLLMANPGEDFNATDVVNDKRIPRKRLAFGGEAQEKCFVLYEQGGVAHTYILAFFALPSKETAQPLWRGYCQPVADLQELRSRVRNGQCSDPVPYAM